MRKAAVRDKATTTVAQDDIERSLAAFTAKRQFLDAAVNMSWQMALTIVVPVVIGVKIDDHFHTSPSYALAALFLGVIASILVVTNSVKRVNKEQNQPTKEKKT